MQPGIIGSPLRLTTGWGSWWEDQIPAIVEAYKDVKPNVNLTIEALPVNGYVDKAVTTIQAAAAWISWQWMLLRWGTLVDKNLLLPWDDKIQDMDLSDFAAGHRRRESLTEHTMDFHTVQAAPIMHYNKTIVLMRQRGLS